MVPSAPRSGDVRHTQASIEKAERLLNYHPTIDFEDGMRRTFDDLRARLGDRPKAARR